MTFSDRAVLRCEHRLLSITLRIQAVCGQGPRTCTRQYNASMALPELPSLNDAFAHSLRVTSRQQQQQQQTKRIDETNDRKRDVYWAKAVQNLLTGFI